MPDAARLGRRALAVLTAGALLLAVSFLDWFGVAWERSEGLGDLAAVNAWQASTRWTAAVLLGAAGAVVWTAGRRVSTGRRGDALAAVLVLTGLLCGLWQWWDAREQGRGFAASRAYAEVAPRPAAAEPSRTARIVISEPYATATESGIIRRDRLMSLDGAGYDSGPRAGFHLGMGLLVAELALVAGIPVRRRPRISGAGAARGRQ
ncbi:MAG TPA: hypothetical protein VHJ17_22955 [Thermomonospora sp.]|nr:hypothetical protein [Thermomonospora sp.]